MSDFQGPIEDITFTLRHVADLDALAPNSVRAPTLISSTVSLLRRAVSSTRWSPRPTATAPDRHQAQRGRQHHHRPVFAEAYGKLVESGWNGIGFPEVYGGGGFPQLLSTAVEEMTTTANMAFALGPLLSRGRHRGDHASRRREQKRSTSRSSSAVNGPAR